MSRRCYSEELLSFHFLLSWFNSLPGTSTGIVSLLSPLPKPETFLRSFLAPVISYSLNWAHFSPGPSVCSKSLRQTHHLTQFISCVPGSVLFSSLLLPPEVFELYKRFAFHTLPKIALLFLLRSFLPLVICRDCSFCLLSPLPSGGLFPCCLLINVCQCPPFPSPNHFLKAHLFHEM